MIAAEAAPDDPHFAAAELAWRGGVGLVGVLDDVRQRADHLVPVAHQGDTLIDLKPHPHVLQASAADLQRGKGGGVRLDDQVFECLGTPWLG